MPSGTVVLETDGRRGGSVGRPTCCGPRYQSQPLNSSGADTCNSCRRASVPGTGSADSPKIRTVAMAGTSVTNSTVSNSDLNGRVGAGRGDAASQHPEKRAIVRQCKTYFALPASPLPPSSKAVTSSADGADAFNSKTSLRRNTTRRMHADREARVLGTACWVGVYAPAL